MHHSIAILLLATTISFVTQAKPQDGTVTVSKVIITYFSTLLDTGSIDLYDSFEGQIDKKGNIISSLNISALFGIDPPPLLLVNLKGSIDSPLQGKLDHYFDVILQLGKKE
ncbi:MAG: hypothetical protein ABGY11_09040 [Candidatus Thioglobus sp.]